MNPSIRNPTVLMLFSDNNEVDDEKSERNIGNINTEIISPQKVSKPNKSPHMYQLNESIPVIPAVNRIPLNFTQCPPP